MHISNDLPPAANFSDALRQLGFPFQGFRGDFRCPFSPVRLYGKAWPVRCYAGATWALQEAIEVAPEGSVLVVDGGGFPDAVLMGGLMSLRARKRNIAGAVIDGAIRDVQEIVEARWPLFATSRTPSGGVHEQSGYWGTPVSCGGVLVSEGDFIIADDDGIVCVPAAWFSKVKERAVEIMNKETFIEAELQQGLSLQDAFSRWEKKNLKP